MNTTAATRGSETAVLEALSAEGSVVGHYASGILVSHIPIEGIPSVADIVAALPGSGWVGRPGCDEWIAAAIAETGGEG